MAWASMPQLLTRKQAFPSGGISLSLVEVLSLWSTRFSEPRSFLWLKPRWQWPGRRLGIGTILPLVWTGLAMAGKKDMPSSLQTLADTRLSIQMTSSICGRKAGTYSLLLRRTRLMQLLFRTGSVPPWQSLAVLTPLWPVSSSGWPQYPFEIPWTPWISLPLPRMHICLDSVSCCKTEGCRRSLGGRSSGRPLICFLLTCRPLKLTYSSQSNVRTFCSSTFDT